MKIVAASDIHNRFPGLRLPPGDVLVIAGDSTGRGTLPEISLFARWMDDQDFTHKIIIAGNHDWAFETQNTLARDIFKKIGVHYLENSEVVIDGFKFWGSPWTPWFFDWAFNSPSPEHIKRFWDTIPADTDVLITHGPPHGILDRTKQGDLAGCRELGMALARVNPQIHLFGHIHEAYGTYDLGATKLYNCSVCSLSYELRNKPWEIELKAPRATASV